MKKILAILALIGAFSFLPIETASAAPHHRAGHAHVVHRVGRVIHHPAVVRRGYVRRHWVGRPVYGRPYCRPYYRVWGPHIVVRL